jgi:hypothetical protein
MTGADLGTLDPADPAEAARCRSLCAAVVLAALADTELYPLGPSGAYIGTADFREVLSLADLDADAAIQPIYRIRRAQREAARQRQEAELYQGGKTFSRAKRASQGTTP